MFYTTLFSELNTHNIDYLLIGGLAVNLYGVPRFTMDVDLIIDFNQKNIDNLGNCIKTLGLYTKDSIKLETLVDTQKRKALIKEQQMAAVTLLSHSSMVPMVQILIHHQLDFQKAYSNSITRDLAGIPVRLASIEDLVILKKTTRRSQDNSDISHLTQSFDHQINNPEALNGFCYFVSDEQLTQYAAMNSLERLQWVEDARLFSLMAQTPESKALHDEFRQVIFNDGFET
jgi:hypothetical protein